MNNVMNKAKEVMAFVVEAAKTKVEVPQAILVALIALAIVAIL